MAQREALPVTAAEIPPFLCVWETLTWRGNTVSVPRHIVVQSEQHHPRGQGEHASQETVENQVEQQNEGCRKLEKQK